MNKKTRKTLVDITPRLMEFRSLPQKTQEELFPLLGAVAQSALQLIDLLESMGETTYEELAAQLGQNPQTISQKLHALIEGGYPIQLDERTAIAKTGRLRRTAKLL
ncbi:HTH domain-containing protein [Spirulina subsalsa]|uniref:HTH domain-containing protein n=1 Tax=Spirulina subsalsa TaxID=54311 RepID=UPI00036975CC|nr:HTH domain-containing protein [Spirulina subsalsa]